MLFCRLGNSNKDRDGLRHRPLQARCLHVWRFRKSIKSTPLPVMFALRRPTQPTHSFVPTALTPGLLRVARTPKDDFPGPVGSMCSGEDRVELSCGIRHHGTKPNHSRIDIKLRDYLFIKVFSEMAWKLRVTGSWS